MKKFQVFCERNFRWIVFGLVLAAISFALVVGFAIFVFAPPSAPAVSPVAVQQVVPTKRPTQILPTTTPTVEPTAEVKEDPFAMVRGCGVTYAKVLLGMGTVNAQGFGVWDEEPDPKTVRSDGKYERWGILNISGEEIPTYAMKDRWGNSIVGIFDMSASGGLDSSWLYNSLYVYNTYGLLAYVPTGEAKLVLYESGFCQAPATPYEWSPLADMKFAGAFGVKYPASYDHGIAQFYFGKHLSEPELYAYEFMLNQTGGTRWSSLGFIGQGTSSHGGYSIRKVDGRYEFFWVVPGDENYRLAIRTGVVAPMYTEIEVHSKNSLNGFWQRFILVPTSWDDVQMLELPSVNPN